MIEKWFKAETIEERSGDILVPFSSSWIKKIERPDFSVVFRKKIPSADPPKRMFIYVGSPSSKIVGYAPIRETKKIRKEDALELADKAALNRLDISDYCRGHTNLGCYVIGSIKLFKHPITLVELQETSGFNPPQSFLFMSKKATKWLSGLPTMELDSISPLSLQLKNDERQMK